MILDAPTRTVEIVLAEAQATTACDITASYATQSPTAFVTSLATLATSGTTAVTVIPAPDAGNQIQVQEVRLHNNDSVNHTVVLRVNDGGTIRIALQQTLTPGADFLYTPTTSSNPSGYTLPTATASVLGGVKPDGTTIANTAGAISVAYGTAANTAAQGNDSRITGALAASVAASTYAPLASPALTGTPTAPTATAGTSTTQLATTAFVAAAVTAGAYVLPTASTSVLGGVRIDGTTVTISGGVLSAVQPAASSTTPAMNGTAAVGTGTTFARADHVHPSDTSRAPLASPTFTGTVTIPAGASIAGYATLAGPTFTASTIVQGSIRSAPASGDAVLIADAVSGSSRYTSLRNGGSNRWQYGTNNATESGSNVGTDFTFVRFSDAGTSIDTPLTITRSTGVFAFLYGPTGPTAAANTNTTQLATTAYVVGQAATTAPAVDGTAAVGTSLLYARQDHVHPTDTSRAPLASPTFTGSVTIPGGAINNTPIGASTPNSGAFTTLSASGAVSGAGFTALVAPYAPLASPTFTGTVTIPGGTFNNLNAVGTQFTVTPTTTATAAYVQLKPTGFGTDANNADMLMGGSGWQFRFLNDAYSASNTWLSVTRSGYTIQTITLAGVTLQINAAVAVSGAITLTGSGQMVVLNGAAANNRTLAWQTSGSLRWTMLANNTAEAGSNAGSDWFLNALSDTGAFIGSPISCTRATLAVAFGGAAAAATSLGVGGTSGPTWTSGTAAPTATAPVGSLYSRVGGAVGATLYVSRGAGTWAAVSGV